MAPGKPCPNPSLEFRSDQFVESCGAVLFDLADSQDKKVCIVQPSYNKEYLLAKGRRNLGESRKDAALREVMEETGYRCRLLPVTMPTRATQPTASPDVRDSARTYADLTEPFWCTVRQMKGRTKIIWWYIAALESDGDAGKLPGEEKYRPLFVTCQDALTMLTYESDRALVARAIGLVDATIFGGKALPVSNGNKAQQSEPKPAQSQKRRRKKKPANASAQTKNVTGEHQRLEDKITKNEEGQKLEADKVNEQQLVIRKAAD